MPQVVQRLEAGHRVDFTPIIGPVLPGVAGQEYPNHEVARG